MEGLVAEPYVSNEEAERLGYWIISWLREELRKSGARGLIFGLSGGIDSAVVAGLAIRAAPGRSLGVIMPCHSQPQDIQDAELVARHFGLETLTVDLSGVYDNLLQLLQSSAGASWTREVDAIDAATERLALANLKPRLRMLTLYFYANLLHYLVVGTGNRSELAVGYFTKYGDSGVDLLPLGNLVKAQVRAVARWLHIPQSIIDKPPSAGLWPGQTDEKEMGITYAELDSYLLGRSLSPAVTERIQALMRRSEHKRRPAPICPLPPDH
ncbi:MAG: NAD(+) synthase [Limnochordales bacterium]|nr:NAD(+) synthase [Limnochordales bacterium]